MLHQVSLYWQHSRGGMVTAMAQPWFVTQGELSTDALQGHAVEATCHSASWEDTGQVWDWQLQRW